VAIVGIPIAGIAKLSGCCVTDIGGRAIAGMTAPGACIMKASGCDVGTNCCGHGGKESTPLDCVSANCCGTGGHCGRACKSSPACGSGGNCGSDGKESLPELRSKNNQGRRVVPKPNGEAVAPNGKPYGEAVAPNGSGAGPGAGPKSPGIKPKGGGVVGGFVGAKGPIGLFGASPTKRAGKGCAK